MNSTFKDSAAQPEENSAHDAISELPADLLRIERRISKMVASDPPLTGMDTVICWYGPRIQPLADHGSRLLCEYTGTEDPMWATKSGAS